LGNFDSLNEYEKLMVKVSLVKPVLKPGNTPIAAVYYRHHMALMKGYLI
jgi:hypothetical protein